MKSKIKEIIISCLEELKEDNQLSFEVSEDMNLIGSNGQLDSIDFVSLVVELEDKISEEFDKDVSILNEKAFSQNNSPFLNIESFSNYIMELLK